MAKIEYTVYHSVFVDNDIVSEVEKMDKAGTTPSTICKYIMDRTGYSLHTANCIRKVLTQGTNEFNLSIE